MIKNLRAIGLMILLIIGESISFPLIIISISTAVLSSFSWVNIIFIILAILISLPANHFFIFIYHYIQLKQLDNFADKYRNCDFVELSLVNFFKEIYNEKFNASEMSEGHFQEFIESVIPQSRNLTSQGFLTIKLIYVNNDHDKDIILPGTWVTYNFNDDPWIFIRTNLSDLNGLQKFQILHEIGHTSAMGNTDVIPPIKGGNYLFAVIISCFILYSSSNIEIYIKVSMILLVIVIFTLILFKKNSEIIDEINADFFAFERALPQWFKKYKEKPSLIAEKICSVTGKKSEIGFFGRAFNVFNKRRSDSTTSSKISKHSQWRIKIFADNVEKIKNGLPPSISYPTNADYYLVFMNVLIFIFLVYTGKLITEITLIDVLILFGALICVFFSSYVMYQMLNMVKSAIGENIQISQPISEENRKDLNKVAELRMKFDHRMSKFKKRKGPPGNLNTLFTSDEIDIYFIKKTNELIIYHGVDVNYSLLSKVIYHKNENWVIIEMHDGTRLDLGVSIQKHMRPYWEESRLVTFAQTKNQELINSILVPLTGIED